MRNDVILNTGESNKYELSFLQLLKLYLCMKAINCVYVVLTLSDIIFLSDSSEQH
jgi:hypothetical protein